MRPESSKDSIEMELTGGIKLLHAVTLSKVNTSSASTQPGLITDVRNEVLILTQWNIIHPCLGKTDLLPKRCVFGGGRWEDN